MTRNIQGRISRAHKAIMTGRKRIAILTLSVGSGHVRAAEVIQAALLTAFQVQSALAVTLMLAELGASVKDWLVGEIA